MRTDWGRELKPVASDLGTWVKYKPSYPRLRRSAPTPASRQRELFRRSAAGDLAARYERG